MVMTPHKAKLNYNSSLVRLLVRNKPKKQKTKTKEKEDVKASLICHSLFFYVHAQAHKFCEAVRCRKLFALYVAQTKFSNLSIFIRGEVLWVFY